MDFLDRKLGMEKGNVFMSFLNEINKVIAAAKEKDRIFYEGIITTARFYIETVLPATIGKMKAVQGLSDAALMMDEKAFG